MDLAWQLDQPLEELGFHTSPAQMKESNSFFYLVLLARLAMLEIN